MRILHTADWHLGQIFFGYDRKEEHIIFLNWLIKQIKQYKIDILLIAGDIFESSNPSADSQKIYYNFLKTVVEENPFLQIIIIAGNHDSAARLEAPSLLLEDMNIWIRGIIKKRSDGQIDQNHLLIPLKKKGVINAWCLAVPYLRQGDYPKTENSDSYTKGVQLFYENLLNYAKDKIGEHPLIVMGHLHVGGTQLSDQDFSERADNNSFTVSSKIFTKDISYVALGHIHKYQKIEVNEGCSYIYYAGSPLPMSFTEKNYMQGVNMIEIEGNNIKNVERFIFEAPVKLISFPAQNFSKIKVELETLPEKTINEKSNKNLYPFLEIKIAINEPQPSLKYQIEEILKNKAIRLTRISVIIENNNSKNATQSLIELHTIDPMVLAEDIFFQQYHQKMPSSLKVLLEQIMQEIN